MAKRKFQRITDRRLVRELTPAEREDALGAMGVFADYPDDEPVWCLHCERVSAIADLRTHLDSQYGMRFVECSYEDCDGSLMDLSLVRGTNSDRSFTPRIKSVPKDWERGKVYPLYGE